MRGLRLSPDPSGRVHNNGEGAGYKHGPEPAATIFCAVRFHDGNIRSDLPVPNGIFAANAPRPSGTILTMAVLEASGYRKKT